MASRFWVGGGGTWDASDTSHWASSSGGASGASVPGSSDTVTIDASSGAGSITVSTSPTITTFTTTNASLGISSGGANTITVTGNITTNTRNMLCKFAKTGSGTISTGSGTLGGLTITHSSGTVTVSNDIHLSGNGVVLASTGGTITFSGEVFLETVIRFEITGSGTRTINMPSRIAWTASAGTFSSDGISITTATGLTLNASSTVLDFSGTTRPGNRLIDLEGKAVGELRMSTDNTNAPSYEVTSALTVDTLGVNADYGKATLSLSNTVTVNTAVDIAGTSGNQFTISGGTLSKASGTVTVTYTTITNNTGSGGATFDATDATNVDSGGNSGWLFAVSGQPAAKRMGGVPFANYRSPFSMWRNFLAPRRPSLAGI